MHSVRISTNLEMDITRSEVEFDPPEQGVDPPEQAFTRLNRGLTPSEHCFTRLNRNLIRLNNDLTPQTIKIMNIEFRIMNKEIGNTSSFAVRYSIL
jgi:hypothetical protein